MANFPYGRVAGLPLRLTWGGVLTADVFNDSTTTEADDAASIDISRAAITRVGGDHIVDNAAHEQWSRLPSEDDDAGTGLKPMLDEGHPISLFA